MSADNVLLFTPASCEDMAGEVTTQWVANGIGLSGPANRNWKGGRTVDAKGYIKLATGRGPSLSEHLVVAERAIGKPLRQGVEVHHFNRDRADNRNRNLVICENRAYHLLLHVLDRIRKAGGRPFEDGLCSKCRLVKPREAFYQSRVKQIGLSSYCRSCNNACATSSKRQRVARSKAAQS